jgi:hypothetical protein
MTPFIVTINSDSDSRRGYLMAKENLSAMISFLRTGWWIVHVLGITLVYILGHLVGS